jgi:peptidoglycan/xylan/chitin deacetylase (PgdA/CDA1 family)
VATRNDSHSLVWNTIRSPKASRERQSHRSGSRRSSRSISLIIPSLPISEPAESRRPALLALAYHDVSSDPATSGFPGAEAAHYKLSPERFLTHLDAIAEAGLVPRTIADPIADEDVRVLLTFDDGGRSCASVIAPALAERGWRAHFFLVTDLLDTPGFLTAAEARELDGRGHVVGSHSHSHHALTRLSRAEIESELRESRAVLEEVLQKPVTTFAVPGGFYSASLDPLAAEAGYTHLFTSEPWLRPRVRSGVEVYGRFAVYSRTSDSEVALLCRLSRSLVLRRRAGWIARKQARAFLGPAYRTARSAVLRRSVRQRDRG